MRQLDARTAIKMALRGTWKFAVRRPLAVSFEVTHSCSCNCRHCDHGGRLKGEKRLSAEDYHRLELRLRPVLLQLSGGEPTLRPDLVDIVRAVKEPSGMPYLILVSNGSELTEDLYLQCVEAGVNQFSISLDFPDERHDDFRRNKGLYRRLSDLIPRLSKYGYDNIVMNTAITRWNLPYLEDCYRRAKEWGVGISYSAYTSLRTGNSEFDIRDEDDLELLRRTIDRLLEIKYGEGGIVNSDWTLRGTYRFFRDRGIPHCKAGVRSLVVNPDGTFRPCSMYDLRYRDLGEVKREFVRHNTCGACYVSIRAYLNESYWTLLTENIKERVLGKTGADCSCQTIPASTETADKKIAVG
ncbi:MAG TPA: radical SAM protein [Acidobacteriota bacterium]|nr:radical SAM protein [Acidobacteriota bacterium]HRV09244.1 radical SAM protein [Acidobacteriota bacterium]